MNILLIYEIVPDETRFYYLENVDKETAEKLMKCNDNLAGQVGCEPLVENWLPMFLEDQKQIAVPFQVSGDTTVILSGSM